MSKLRVSVVATGINQKYDGGWTVDMKGAAGDSSGDVLITVKGIRDARLFGAQLGVVDGVNVTFDTEDQELTDAIALDARELLQSHHVLDGYSAPRTGENGGEYSVSGRIHVLIDRMTSELVAARLHGETADAAQNESVDTVDELHEGHSALDEFVGRNDGAGNVYRIWPRLQRAITMAMRSADADNRNKTKHVERNAWTAGWHSAHESCVACCTFSVPPTEPEATRVAIRQAILALDGPSFVPSPPGAMLKATEASMKLCEAWKELAIARDETSTAVSLKQWGAAQPRVSAALLALEKLGVKFIDTKAKS